jgi:hypothetical protein
MRSRYQHDGSVDYHAEGEHEILRRADEALERQRLAAHSAVPMNLSVPGLAKSSRPTGAPGATPLAPPFPHEEIAARLTPKLTPTTMLESGLSWPPSQSPSSATSPTKSRRH